MQRSESPNLNKLRAVVYSNRPDIFNGFRSSLSELLSIARTFAELHKYEITLNALNAVASLLLEYLRIRDGDLMMPSSVDALVGTTDLLFDTVLTESLEGISSLQKAAIRDEDIKLSAQITDALEHLALGSVGTKSLSARPDENPTTSFIRAYMSGPVLDGAARGLDDVAMGGARALTNIATALLKKHQYVTARTTIDDIEKLAYFGIMQRKSHVTGTAVRGIAEILQLILSEPIPHRSTTHAVLDALQRICVAELQFKSPPLDQGLRFSLGAFLDLTQPTALANLEAQAIRGLSAAYEQANKLKADEYREVIAEFNHSLWSRLFEIGKVAASTESFALFYLNQNIAEIVKCGLWLLEFLDKHKPKATDQASAHELWIQEQYAGAILKDLEWTVGATYWRIFGALPSPVNWNAIWDFFPTLSHIGIQALDASAPSLAESAISALKSISIKAIDLPVQGLQKSARIAAFMARIGIIAEKVGEQSVLTISLAALNEFQSRYFAKQKEMAPAAEAYGATLLNELDDLKSELRNNRWLIDEEDAAFLRRVVPADIDNFAARLEIPR
jgi:hypothetical protein